MSLQLHTSVTNRYGITYILLPTECCGLTSSLEGNTNRVLVSLSIQNIAIIYAYYLTHRYGYTLQSNTQHSIIYNQQRHLCSW